MLQTHLFLCSCDAVGNDLKALRSGRNVPFGESSVTRLLQASLAGNAVTLVLAAVSPIGEFLGRDVLCKQSGVYEHFTVIVAVVVIFLDSPTPWFSLLYPQQVTFRPLCSQPAE